MKRAIPLALLAAFAAMTAPTGAPGEKGERTVQIVYESDNRGYYLPCG